MMTKTQPKYITDLSKKEMYSLMQALKPYSLTFGVISRESERSYPLVQLVFQGNSKNEDILKVIFNNLKDGWQSAIEPAYIPLILPYIDHVHEPENGVSAVGVSAP